MHIIIGLGAAVALLYFWLLGHWFARILVCLVLIGCAGLFGFIILVATMDKYGPFHGLIAFLLAAGGAWPVASLPIWYGQKRLGIA